MQACSFVLNMGAAGSWKFDDSCSKIYTLSNNLKGFKL